MGTSLNRDGAKVRLVEAQELVEKLNVDLDFKWVPFHSAASDNHVDLILSSVYCVTMSELLNLCLTSDNHVMALPAGPPGGINARKSLGLTPLIEASWLGKRWRICCSVELM